MGPVLRHSQGRRWQVVHLASRLRRRYLLAGRLGMARLATCLAAPRLALATCTQRGCRTILQGWLTTVAAVPLELTPQLRQFALQGLHGYHQSRHDRMPMAGET